MSGLEALAILGLACNVMQVISFSHETISTCRRIYDGSSDDGLSTLAEDLEATVSSLENHLGVLPQPATRDEAALVQLARKCSGASQKVRIEAKKYKVTGNKRKGLKALALTVKMSWNKRELDKIEKNLMGCKDVLETQLLVRLCAKQDALQEQNGEEFQNLNRTLQEFIRKYGLGYTKLEDLIKLNTKAMQDTVVQQREITDGHVSRQHEEMNTLVRDESDKTRQEFSKSTAIQLDQRQREKLLDSLNFSGRNERLNNIREAHYESFDWLFESTEAPHVGVASLDSQDDTTKQVPRIVGQTYHDNNIYDQGDDDWVLENITYKTKQRAWASFRRWLESDEQLYWVCGKAGAGKSTLMRLLYTNPKTQSVLDHGREGETILLWHFFYLIGKNPMQHNIKGLLCNLLHQLLEYNGNALMAHLLNLFPATKNKSSDSDWSERELRASFFSILQHVLKTRRLCIFVDGLDEIHTKDGPEELLKLIRDIRLIDNRSMKLCVSSRGEAVFKKELSAYPLLHLHNLTAPDIYRYTFNNFKDSENCASGNILNPAHETEWSYERQKRFYPTPNQRLAWTIVEKSEGVFLWAYLAIQSLKRAECNEDTAETIQKRLESLPRDLKDLYSSMWSRLNDDEQLYKAEAALYFNLVIEYSNQRLVTYYSRTGHQPMIPTVGHISLAREAIDNPMRDGKIFSSPLESIGPDCKKHYHGIQIRCAGLLEFSPRLYSEVPKPGREFLYPDMEVIFIHRTAREFLLETPEGRSILNEDKLPKDLRLAAILHSWLLRSWTFLSPQCIGNQRICSLQSYLHYGWPGGLRKIYSKLPKATKLRWVEAWHSILLDMPASCFSQRHDVLGEIARESLKDFVSLSFRESNIYTEEYKAFLLDYASRSLRPTDWSVTDCFDTIDFLLSQGCAPRDISQWHLSSRYDAFMTDCNPFVTFLGSLLEGFWGNISFVGNIGVRILQTLQTFLEHKADLTQEIYCFLRQGAIRDSFGYPLERVSSHLYNLSREGNVILLKVTANEILRRLAQSLRDIDFGDQLAKIISPLNFQPPEILVVGYGHRQTWSRCARRVDGILEQRLQEVIIRTKPLESPLEAIEFQIQKEIDDIVEGYDFDGEKQGDLTEYLLFEEGLLRKNPTTLYWWLGENVDRDTWSEMERARRAVPTKYLCDVLWDDYSEAFPCLWGSD